MHSRLSNTMQDMCFAANGLRYTDCKVMQDYHYIRHVLFSNNMTKLLFSILEMTQERKTSTANDYSQCLQRHSLLYEAQKNLRAAQDRNRRSRQTKSLLPALQSHIFTFASIISCSSSAVPSLRHILSQGHLVILGSAL